MLFSNNEIVKVLEDNFECAWESVRPVPRVEIDFRNGTRLTRTLNGNIATYFCTPEGKVYDLLPGLVSADEFLSRTRLAIDLYTSLRKSKTPEALLSLYHGKMSILVGSDAKTLKGTAMHLRILPDLSKAFVEAPMKYRLAAEMFEATAGTHLARETKKAASSSTDSLTTDDEYNLLHRYPKAHAMLAANPLVRPAEITKKVYKDVLHVDLDDPYLGLAPYVLGGEGGRR